MKATLVSLLIAASSIGLSCGQGFINLNFESATFVHVAGSPSDTVQFAQAFPGWTGTVGGIPPVGVLSNSYYLGTAGFSIINSNFNNFSIIPGGLIQGRYTAILYSGSLTNSQTGVDTSLSQTGLVPVGTHSLQFKALEVFDALGAFTVTLGGQTLPLSVLGGGTVDIYAVGARRIGQRCRAVRQFEASVPARHA